MDGVRATQIIVVRADLIVSTALRYMRASLPFIIVGLVTLAVILAIGGE